MLAVRIKVLKNKLSEYVRRLASGETVLITDRERVVAELRAPSNCRAEHVEDAALVDLVARGLLRSPLQRTEAPPERYHRKIEIDDLLKQLDADRADR